MVSIAIVICKHLKPLSLSSWTAGAWTTLRFVSTSHKSARSWTSFDFANLFKIKCAYMCSRSISETVSYGEITLIICMDRRDSMILKFHLPSIARRQGVASGGTWNVKIIEFSHGTEYFRIRSFALLSDFSDSFDGFYCIFHKFSVVFYWPKFAIN